MNGNGRVASAPAAAAVGTHVFLAARGLDGNLYLNQADLGGPFGQWFSMNFTTDVAPAVTSVADNVLFFAKSSDGRIFLQQAQLGRGGSAWAEIGGDGRTNAAPAAAAIGNHIFVCVKGPRRKPVPQPSYFGGPFGQWFPMNFATDVAPAVASVEDYLLFFAKSLDGRIFFQRAKLGQGGEGWVEVAGDGRTDDAPAAAAVGSHLFVTVRGLGGNLFLNQADLGGAFGEWLRME